jgi:hypothetical protein
MVDNDRDSGAMLGEFDAFGAVATVGGMAGHGGMAAGGAEEPFPIGSCVHEFEIAILNAIGAAYDLGAVSLESLCFENEGITFFVHGKATMVRGGVFGGEGFAADRAAGSVVVHQDRSVSNLARRQFECER